MLERLLPESDRAPSDIDATITMCAGMIVFQATLFALVTWIGIRFRNLRAE